MDSLPPPPPPPSGDFKPKKIPLASGHPVDTRPKANTKPTGGFNFAELNQKLKSRRNTETPSDESIPASQYHSDTKDQESSHPPLNQAPSSITQDSYDETTESIPAQLIIEEHSREDAKAEISQPTEGASHPRTRTPSDQPKRAPYQPQQMGGITDELALKLRARSIRSDPGAKTNNDPDSKPNVPDAIPNNVPDIILQTPTETPDKSTASTQEKDLTSKPAPRRFTPSAATGNFADELAKKLSLRKFDSDGQPVSVVKTTEVNPEEESHPPLQQQGTEDASHPATYQTEDDISHPPVKPVIKSSVRDLANKLGKELNKKTEVEEFKEADTSHPNYQIETEDDLSHPPAKPVIKSSIRDLANKLDKELNKKTEEEETKEEYLSQPPRTTPSNPDTQPLPQSHTQPQYPPPQHTSLPVTQLQYPPHTSQPHMQPQYPPPQAQPPQYPPPQQTFTTQQQPLPTYNKPQPPIPNPNPDSLPQVHPQTTVSPTKSDVEPDVTLEPYYSHDKTPLLAKPSSKNQQKEETGCSCVIL